MTESVTFSVQIGGDGSTYSDGTGAGGMAEGGHRTYFFPLLQQYVAVADFMTDQVALAADYAASAANAPGTSASQTAGSISVGTGAKSFTIQTGKSFSKGQRVVAASDADPTKYVNGPITAFTPGSGAITINADAYGGSGSITDAIVSLSASGGVPSTRTLTAGGLVSGGGDLSANRAFTVTAATAAQVRAGSATNVVMVPGTTLSAAEEVTLTYGATVTPDLSAFINGRVTLTGNVTLANPTNHLAGMSGRIAMVQDSTGNRSLSSWGSYYRCDGGRPVLSTAGGSVDYLYYDVVNATEIMCTFSRGPTN